VLVIDTAEAAVLAELADRIIAGESVWRLSRELNERRVPTPRSEARRLSREGREGGDLGVWRVTSINKVMTGEFLRGFQRHQGALITGPDGLPVRVWPAALDDARWFQVRDILAPAPGYERPQRRRAARVLSAWSPAQRADTSCTSGATNSRAVALSTGARASAWVLCAPRFASPPAA
jgi:hypothetical protein